jgi:hypothetical protein
MKKAETLKTEMLKSVSACQYFNISAFQRFSVSGFI